MDKLDYIKTYLENAALLILVCKYLPTHVLGIMSPDRFFYE